MQDSLIENSPPFRVLVGIWWGMIWRAAIWWAAFVVACLLCLVLLAALLIYGLDMEQDHAVDVSTLIFYPPMMGAVFVAPVAVIKRLFGKKFRGYRLLLVKAEPAVEASAGVAASAAD